jgi:histidinol-phosphate/aromatic aminotransferase/cobyric acid decarboxylase-like protein
MDGTVVRIAEDGVISDFVPKKFFNYSEKDRYYKTVNIYKFSKDFSVNTYIPFLESYIKSMGTNEYYEQVLRVIASLEKCELKAFVLDGQKWYEIDDVQDKDIAETIFAHDAPAKLSLISRRFGGYWRFPALLDYCYLVNPYFPPPRLCDEIKSNFETLLAGYPSGLSVQNLLAAKMFNVDEEAVLAGNGAAELIRALSGAISGKVCVIQPTFNEYAESLQKNERIQIVYKTATVIAYTKNDVLEWSKECDCLVLINPDNPSGNYMAKDDVLEIAAYCKAHKKTLVLDESFVDFAAGQEQHSLIDQRILDAHPSLILIKSLSKSYGIPGLRLGVLACGDRGIVADIRKNLPIWNINSFAEYFLQIIGKYKTAYRESCVKIAAERERFSTELTKTGLCNVRPSQANYLLCEIKNGLPAASLAAFLLERHNIFIKDLTGKAGIPADASYIRLAVRGREDNDRLLRALSDTKTIFKVNPPPPPLTIL